MALLSKSILCEKIYKKIVLFSVLYIFEICISELWIPNCHYNA